MGWLKTELSISYHLIEILRIVLVSNCLCFFYGSFIHSVFFMYSSLPVHKTDLRLISASFLLLKIASFCLYMLLH